MGGHDGSCVDKGPAALMQSALMNDFGHAGHRIPPSSEGEITLP